MKIAMYGSGAAGSVFASYLRKGGADMILIDRYKEHMDKVAKDGMKFTIHLQEGGEYRDIVEQLTGGPKHIDEIVDGCQLPAGRVLASMTLLEVKGYIRRLPARRFSLAEK